MADMSGEQMQAKITAARREAEGLKDKIKRRKDELADSNRTLLSLFLFRIGEQWRTDLYSGCGLSRSSICFGISYPLTGLTLSLPL